MILVRGSSNIIVASIAHPAVQANSELDQNRAPSYTLRNRPADAAGADGDEVNVATGTAHTRAGHGAGGQTGFGRAGFAINAAPKSMRTGACQAPTNRPSLRGQPATIPDPRFYRIPRFSPVAEGVADRSIAQRAFGRMVPICSSSCV
jgi:hypothetical protein